MTDGNDRPPYGGIPDTPGPALWRPLIPAEHQRHRPWWRRLVSPWLAGVAAALWVAGLIVAATVHVDYVAFVPGGVADLGGRITVTGAPEYPPKGRIFLATVGLTSRLTLLQVAAAWIDPDRDVKRFSDVYGSGRRDERQRNQVMMDDSKQVAALVAVRQLGGDGKGEGVRITEVVKGSPAAGRLGVGDVVLEINARPVCVNGDLRAAVRAGGRKDPVRLTVRRQAGGALVQVTLLPAYDPQAQVRYLGVVAETVRCTLPVDIKVETGSIGGPSAGLSMTLAILDRLTPGELTGGTLVAATGTIDVDGKVGDVGGVRQKTAAVRAAGAKLFLVPPGEELDARARAGDLPVVVVRNLTDALAALRHYGGQSLPSPGAAP